jgi:asparagine synthase (glutamine-hydrolysing)
MMSADLAGYLPDYILTKMDRASMAHSLEVRAPFLDRRIVELASRLPLDMKVGNGTDKRVVRRLLAGRLPAAAARPKCGFDPPLAKWLRGPLREWAEDLLGEADLRREGVFDPAVVRGRWQEQVDARRDWSFHIWSLLIFRSWSEAQCQVMGTARGGGPTRPSARTDERPA